MRYEVLRVGVARGRTAVLSLSRRSVRAVGHHEYTVRFSDEDGEWVATTNNFPSLPWLEESPTQALAGLVRLVAEVEADF